MASWTTDLGHALRATFNGEQLRVVLTAVSADLAHRLPAGDASNHRIAHACAALLVEHADDDTVRRFFAAVRKERDQNHDHFNELQARWDRDKAAIRAAHQPHTPAPQGGIHITGSTIGAGAVIGNDAQGHHSIRAGRDVHVHHYHPTPAPRAATLDGLLHAGTLTLPENPADRLPSQLLQAAYEVVPFVDRPELGQLRDWCGTEASLGVRLFTGEGGSGKTRLLIEACKRQREAGWAAGFLWDADQLPDDALDRILNTDTDRLIVLDYAETRRTFLTKLLKRAIAATPKARLRIALLARNAGDWWSELKRTNRHISHHLTGQHHRLTALFTTVDERPARFEAAARALATAKGWDVPDTPAHGGLRDDVLGQPLYLWMAALLALQGKQLSTASDLLDETLAHEQRFWLRRLRERGWALEVDELEDWVGPVVAGVTLLGGAKDKAEAGRIIDAADSLPEPRKQRRPVLKLLRDLYPGQAGRWLMGLQPDVLGEHLVAQHLSKDLVTAVLDEVFDGVSSVLTTLNRLAKRDASQRRWIQIALGNPKRLDQCVRIAMDVAIETGNPIGIVLAEELKRTELTEQLDELYWKCPDQTVALMPVATVLSQQRLTQIGKRLDKTSTPISGDEHTLEEHALRLLAAGFRLSKQGNPKDALQKTQQALDISIELHHRNPSEYKSLLAMSLNNMGPQLLNIGQFERALIVTNEAVLLRRKLIRKRPEVFLPELAMSLHNLGAILSEMGRLEDALTANQESVKLRRAFADERPDVFLADFASSLCQLGRGLNDLGRSKEALTATQESVDIYRILAQQKPDAFLPDFANALNNLVLMLVECKHYATALSTAEEAVNLIRKLANQSPDAFRPNLAAYLNNFGMMLNTMGRRKEALKVVKEAASLYREFVQNGDKANLPKLAATLHNQGILNRDLNNKEALTTVQDAVSLYRILAHEHHEAFGHKLANSLLLVSLIQHTKEGNPVALPPVVEAIQLLKPFFINHPQAFLERMISMCQHYDQVTRALNIQPNAAFLAPIIATFGQLNSTD